MRFGNIFWLNSNVIKFSTTGSNDTSFGTNGSINVVANSLIKAYQCRVLKNNLYIFADNALEVMGKFDFNGVKDTSFGTNGVVAWPSLNLDTTPKIIANNDGTYFLSANDKTDGWKLKIIKLTSSGQIDTNFSMIDIEGASASTFKDILPLSDDKFLVIRKSNSIDEVYIDKYTNLGVKDINFGNLGTLTVNTPSSLFFVNSLNEIFNLNNSTTQQYLKKYNSDGSVDLSFANNGIFNISTFNTGYNININNIDFDSVNNILLFGGGDISSANIFIGRITSTGSLDNTFNNNTAYYKAAEVLTNNISGKVINDNEFICFTRTPSSSLVSYRGSKFIRSSSQSLSVLEEKADEFKIYPNPAADFIIIDLPENEKIHKVNIYSLTGELVINSTDSKININNLNTGNYIIEVIGSNKKYKRKFIKN